MAPPRAGRTERTRQLACAPKLQEDDKEPSRVPENGTSPRRWSVRHAVRRWQLSTRRSRDRAAAMTTASHRNLRRRTFAPPPRSAARRTPRRHTRARRPVHDHADPHRGQGGLPGRWEASKPGVHAKGSRRRVGGGRGPRDGGCVDAAPAGGSRPATAAGGVAHCGAGVRGADGDSRPGAPQLGCVCTREALRRLDESLERPMLLYFAAVRQEEGRHPDQDQPLTCSDSCRGGGI
jgi:hypothetical protein